MEKSLRQLYAVSLDERRKQRIWEYMERWPEKREQLVLNQIWTYSLICLFLGTVYAMLYPLLALLVVLPLLELVAATMILEYRVTRRLNRAWRARQREPLLPPAVAVTGQ